MKTVKLYGALGKAVGKSFQFDAKNVAEVLRALKCVVPGYKEFMATSEQLYTIYVGYEDKTIFEYDNPSGSMEIIRIVPLVSGAGSLGRIIIGGALIYFSAGIGAVGASALFGTGAGTMVAASLISSAASSIGWSLVLGGVSSLLFSPPTTADGGSYEKTSNLPSYVFNGAVNTTRQGNAIPVGYGRMRIGSQVISAGLFAQSL